MRKIGLLAAVVVVLTLQGCGLYVGGYYDSTFTWDDDWAYDHAGYDRGDGHYTWVPQPDYDPYTPPPHDGGSDSGPDLDDDLSDDSGTNIPLAVR